MSSIREQIMLKLVTAIGTVTGVTAYRSRQRAIAEANLPSLVLRPGDDQPEQLLGGDVDHHLTVEFELKVAGTDATADPYVVLLHAAIMADRKLAGLALNITEGRSAWQFDDDGQEYTTVNVSYVVWYRTSDTALDVAA